MRHRWFLAMVCWLALEPAWALCQETQIRALASQSHRALLNRDFAQAESLFDKIAALDPQDPLPFFGRMSVAQLKMLENFDYRHPQAYQQAAAQAEEHCDQLSDDRAQQGAWRLFICAAAYGLAGFEAIRRDEFWQGLHLAKEAYRLITLVRQREPDFVDAKLGDGLYVYWRSYFTNKLKFLPFFKDRRLEGIAYLKEVAAKGELGRDLARSGLVFIYLAEKDYVSAEGLISSLMRDYPQNLVYPALHVRTLIQMKRYDDAQREVEAFVAQHPEITTVRTWRAVIAYRRHRYSEAIAQCEDLVALDLPPEYAAYAWYLKGATLEKIDQAAQALAAYKLAYRVDHSMEEALQAIARLRRKN